MSVAARMMLFAAAVACGCGWPATGAELTTITVSAPGREAAPNTPVTLSQVFRQGDVEGRVAVQVDGAAVPAQVDVKRRHPDGSVKHALVSLVVPGLREKGKAVVAFLDAPESDVKAKPAVSARDLLDTGFDAVVTFKFPDGSAATASARRMLEAAGAAPRTWLNGPLASEFLLSGPPTDANGRADPDLNVQFQVRKYAGWDGAWVSAVVENCWDHWAGNIRYDVQVQSTWRGRTQNVYEKKGVDHHSLSRWRRCFWAGTAVEAEVAHDLPYLIRTGVVPRYDTKLKVSEAGVAAARKSWAAARTDILMPGLCREYMPAVGGREDIGPYPTWTARYLLSMDPRLREITLASGDLAGSWPIHVRNAKTGRLVTLDERPEFWILPRGGDCPKFKADRTAPTAPHKYVPDCAHHPSLAYVPYLVTGEFYYLEEMYFWGNFCLTYQWPAGRDNGKGLLKSDQIRGEAWCFRDLVDPAHMAPDGDPEGAYFDRRVRNNIAHWADAVTGPDAGPLGTYREESWETDRTKLGQYLGVAVWQQDFVIWAADHAVDVGYAEAAKFRDHLLKFPIGMLTSAPDFDPQYAAVYFVIVGDRPRTLYKTFKEVWDKTSSLGPHFEQLLGKDKWQGLICWLPMKQSWYKEYTWMVATIGVRAGHPKAQAALTFLETELMPGLRQGFAFDPTFAFTPQAPK